METYFVYITCKDREEALLVGRELVRQRLAACANILDKMTSVYWWQGEVVEDQETVLVVKTRGSHLEALTTAVKACHSYEIPCVVALPITDGNPDYLNWLLAETHNSTSSEP